MLGTMLTYDLSASDIRSYNRDNMIVAMRCASSVSQVRKHLLEERAVPACDTGLRIGVTDAPKGVPNIVSD
jgi:hypothetical protein